MSFTPTPNLPPNPDVRIFFSGLLILEPLPDNTCEVFVNSSAPRHYLTIEVRRKQPGIPDELMMRHVGPLAFIESDNEDEIPFHGLIIRKVTGVPKGILAFDPPNSPADGEPDSLSLAIDMESEEYHKGNRDLGADPETNVPRKLLDVDPLGGRPSILLDDGIFYTAAKTRKELKIILKDPNGPDRPLTPFASLIGANISLDEESHVVMLWCQQGRIESLMLTKEPDVSYEIYIVNDPLYENDAIRDLEKEPIHDEFKEYYKILHRVPSDQQFRMVVKLPDPGAPPLSRGSTKTPCMAILKGR